MMMGGDMPGGGKKGKGKGKGKKTNDLLGMMGMSEEEMFQEFLEEEMMKQMGGSAGGAGKNKKNSAMPSEQEMIN